MTPAITVIVGLAIITAMFVADLWFTRVLNRMLLRLTDKLPAILPRRSRYQSRSMPDDYADFRWRKKRQRTHAEKPE